MHTHIRLCDADVMGQEGHGDFINVAPPVEIECVGVGVVEHNDD